MFSPVYASSSAKQQFSFVVSLTLQCAMLAVLCQLPLSPASHPAFARPDLHSAQVTPLYFQPKPIDNRVPAPADSKPAPALARNGSTLEAPAAARPKAKAEQPVAKAEEPAAKPLEATATPEPEPKAEADTATTATAATDPNAGDGIAPFPSWQMHSNSNGHSFMHHDLKSAMPIFTPDPPILHGQIPDPARGKDVVMNVIINESGAIASVEVLQGVGYGVEQAIVQTLREWIYVPAKFNGMPIPSQQQIKFHFPG